MALQDKVALVTGAGSGLGRAIALALAEEGARLILVARDDQALNAVADQIEQLGADVLVAPCDVRLPEEVSSILDRSTSEFGPVEILVNSAGVGLRKPILETSSAEWDDVFDTLVKGTFLVTQMVLPMMMERKRGNIINLAAPLEQIETPGFAAYSAAKYAVTGFTRTLAREVRRYGINVNGLHPGGFANTAMVRLIVGNVRQELLDPSIITPAAVALAAQPPRGLTGEIIDAIAWNTDPGLGGGLQ